MFKAHFHGPSSWCLDPVGGDRAAAHAPVTKTNVKVGDGRDVDAGKDKEEEKREIKRNMDTSRVGIN